MNAIRNLLEKHRQLKERIHSFRYPLPYWGRVLATAFYMSLPIIGGIYVMDKTILIAHDNVGARGEKLKDVNIGNNSPVVRQQNKELQDILTKAKEIKKQQDQKP